MLLDLISSFLKAGAMSLEVGEMSRVDVPQTRMRSDPNRVGFSWRKVWREN
jgi:hypothetical protein